MQNIDPDNVLRLARLMKIDVASNIMNKEQLEERHPYLKTKVPALFSMIYENEPNYWPMLIKMIDYMKSLDKSEISNVKSRDKWKEMCDDKYVYSVLPGLKDKQDVHDI